MPQHQPEREVAKHAALSIEGKSTPKYSQVMDIPEIVSLHIADVMKDSTHMKDMEADLDMYVRSLTPEERLAQRETICKQLTTGSKVCESILNRYLSS